MLSYARARAIQALQTPCRAVLATGGPAGVRASECPCRARGLELYLLVPQTSDHLFNLEADPNVIVLAPGWEVSGRAAVMPPGTADPGLDLAGEPGAEWCVLVRVEPYQVQIRREGGWGNIETIDLGG